VTRPRAADDFTTIHERMRELRREAAAAPSAEGQPPPRSETPLTDHERRLKERREGHPPPWVPTIFIKSPTNIEISRQFLPYPLGLVNPVRSFWAHQQ
jgi:hypothetical protein